MMKLIAISGKRCTGKDTFTDALVSHAKQLGRSLPQGAFAAECKAAFVTQQQTLGNHVDLNRLLSERAYKEQIRPLLTAFTEQELAKDPLVFVKQVLARFARHGIGVVSDLRLRCELDYLRAHTALFTIRLERPDHLRTQSGWTYTIGTDDHRTETELDCEKDWNLVIQNNQTVEDLQTTAQTLAETLYRESNVSAT
jgi:phosphomevalonate kinase